MRILLVEPPICRFDVGTGVIGLAEPLALECVAGGLAGHDVSILDMRIDPDLQRALREFKPEIVGSGGYTVGVPAIKRILAEAKQFDPGILTVAGGHHATVKPADFNEPSVDLVVVGEGEFTMQEIVAARAEGREFDGIRGLAFRRDGRFIQTPERPLAELDSLPIPARGLVAKYRDRYFRGKWRPIASMFTSRGCPHRCSFCGMWKVNRGKYRMHSPARVVEELRRIPEEYIDLVDDNTFENVGWATRVAEGIKAAGIQKRYKVYSRSDVIARHPELIRLWREIGLEIVLVGLEAVGNAELNKLNKRNSIAENEAALRVLKENNVEIAAFFVVDPDFDEADFDALKAYIDRWELFHPAFTILTPFPGTDLYRAVDDRIRNRNYEIFDFFHAVLPTRLPLPRFYERFVDLYRHAYSFSRAFKYLRQQRFFGVSLGQIALRRRFFAQLENLKNLEFEPVHE